MTNEVLKQLENLRLIPVVSLDSAADAEPLADALVAGGMPVAEITFRTRAAEQSIRILARRTDLLIGAGTVLNVETAQRAVDAGARFIVSPGFNPKVVSWCIEKRSPITPGIATPTEIEMALDHGLEVVKFFPAEALGGAAMLKALAAPYAMMRFIPTGGISAQNVREYLKLSHVLACGGSWMVAKDLIAAKQFHTITELTRKAVELTR